MSQKKVLVVTYLHQGNPTYSPVSKMSHAESRAVAIFNNVNNLWSWEKRETKVSFFRVSPN